MSFDNFILFVHEYLVYQIRENLSFSEGGSVTAEDVFTCSFLVVFYYYTHMRLLLLLLVIASMYIHL